jgi:hypothetical protein
MSPNRTMALKFIRASLGPAYSSVSKLMRKIPGLGGPGSGDQMLPKDSRMHHRQVGASTSEISIFSLVAEVSPEDKVPSVLGVITNDVGVSRDGTTKSSFEPGMIFRSKVTLLAEGAHGSLAKVVLKKYNLRKESEGQTYGFGLKEVWRIAPEGNCIYQVRLTSN